MPQKEIISNTPNLNCKNLETYEHDFFRLRHKLWKEGTVTKEHFPTADLIPIPGEVFSTQYSIEGKFCHRENGKQYYLHIYIWEDFIHPEIQSIEICELTLHYEDLTLIQLCDEGKCGTRPGPTPDEFITITYADVDCTRKRYQRCYG